MLLLAVAGGGFYYAYNYSMRGVNNLSFSNFMKRLFLSVLFVTLCAGLAQAETTTVWAKGVSAEGGWYDVNKQGPNDDNDGDKNMCYAASAANLITWWQDSLTVVPTGTPTDAESVWTAYKNASNSK